MTLETASHPQSGGTEPLLRELSVPDRPTITVPPASVPGRPLDIPSELLRSELPLPEVSEPEVVRHFTRVSRLNVSIETSLYPLGSCTMKYNPKVNEAMASLPGMRNLHPLQPAET